MRSGGTARRRSAARTAAWSAEIAGVTALTLFGAIAYLWFSGEEEGRRGMSPYSISGVRYVPREAPDYREVGVASWYGEPFHGRPTSRGEPYDQEKFTAAHPTLPLGTRVRVTHLASGRSVLLTVNDRGPFVDGRLIDLSRRAARKLGFLNDGLAEVRVEALYSPLR